MPGPGLILLNCVAKNRVSLDRYSANGQILAEQVIPLTIPTSAGPVSPDLNIASCGQTAFLRLANREVFSRDFSQVAVVANNPEPDGSQHVGYIDLATGHFTDVTAATTGSGFGAGGPVDGGALFDPVTDHFWFYRDNGSVYNCLPDTTDCRAVGQTDTSADVYNGIRFDVVNSVWQLTKGDDPPLLSPTAVLAAGSGNSLGDLHLSAATSQDSVAVTVSTPTGNLSCVVAGWIDDSTLLCSDPQYDQLYVVRHLNSKTEAATATPLLPPNQDNDWTPVASPDGPTMAFVDSQGTEGVIYTVQLGASPSEPQKVATLNQGGELLAWVGQ